MEEHPIDPKERPATEVHHETMVRRLLYLMMAVIIGMIANKWAGGFRHEEESHMRWPAAQQSMLDARPKPVMPWQSK